MTTLGYECFWHDFESGRRKNFEIGEKYKKDPDHMKWEKWVPAQNPLEPKCSRVFSTAQTGEKVFIARLKHEDQLLPGYMRNGWAYFVHKGKVIKTKDEHEVLYNGHVKWCMPNRVDERDVVVVGRDEDGNPLFLGTFMVGGTSLYGEVRKGVCNIVVIPEREDFVPCSPDNPIPSYVVGMFMDLSCYPQPGYVYYNQGSFSESYFMVTTDRGLVSNKEEKYFLVGGDVSFRPHREVPENLRFKVGFTKQNKPIYIGTINIGPEEICGSVIDGVCYAFKKSIRSDGGNYKVLALNER
ncbi:Hypothetical predicted protein [Cloeon dipterum]|uniref:Uncharacterized protein n=1 Tax=Cloeon dipterum TaxID=197152 RepID=A0A8S1DKQ3_9INSE|nr:Hypothetical predicted protein [Cloeon dipterum]